MRNDTVPTILVIDEDTVAAQATCTLLEQSGFQARTGPAGSITETIRELTGQGVDVAVIIVGAVPGGSGELVDEIVKRFPHVVPVVVTSFGSVEEAVQVMRRGAVDYLIRPVSPQYMAEAVGRALTRSRLLVRDSDVTSCPGDYGAMVGTDQRMHRVFETARAVAATPTTVLMTGESGTGKSMIARAIHQQSPRADAAFVEISCGSIPETLLESELFGHVKGAFTGAHADKIGKFEAACGGTIFLDEINSAPPAMQMKLLRVLQERVVEPVGSNQPVPVDARIILASNEPLEDLVSSGMFRQDLYYRINVIDIALPSLRDRPADIAALAEHFLVQKTEQLRRRIIGIDPEAMAAMRQYSWPGNVRELENVIERAVVLARGAVIGSEDLPGCFLSGGVAERRPAGFSSGDGEPACGLTLRDAMADPERRIILGALEEHGWNRQDTAASLDINRTTLYKKMKYYGLDRKCA